MISFYNIPYWHGISYRGRREAYRATQHILPREANGEPSLTLGTTSRWKLTEVGMGKGVDD